MRAFWMHPGKWIAMGTVVAMGVIASPCRAQDDSKPTGAPLVLSTVETEQPINLAILDPDGKTARCVTFKLHWIAKDDPGPNDDPTSFQLDIPADAPGASVFMAQLWNASLASAVAWQEPWEGAQWKVEQTPATDGSGLSAALAVGMISTSARRPYPKDTVVIGNLNPDGSLGPVSHIADRLDAIAATGTMARVIIPSVQRFDTDDSGQVLNIVRHASDLHLECVPVDNLVEATEKTMNDPLPDSSVGSSTPKYDNQITTYIDDYARREQSETNDGIAFAPKESELSKYPPRVAAIWKDIYADKAGGEQAYRAGQVYIAFQLFSRANGQMHGMNALEGQNRTNFDVKSVLAESDGLRQRLHDMMTPPAIDKGDMESGLLVAEMSDWAYDIDAALEGAQLVTKQTFSQRTDATDAEKDRAREAILFANEQSKYLLDQADFYTGLAGHLDSHHLAAGDNAARLLPQLIPAQLATARMFSDGIRPRANDLRDGLLFDPRLVAYVGVLREVKADWDTLQHKKDLETEAIAASAPSTNGAPANAAAKPNGTSPATLVAFDPGNTFLPPHTVLVSSGPEKKLSDVAACLVWANHDCEIAALDEKYLHLDGAIDPATHQWHLKDRAKLDAMLQLAEIGARHGIAFAEKTQIDISVLAMIYEKAGFLRIQGTDASALESLRQYWRCALLGNMCWQLAHGLKAQPVDLSALPPNDATNKTPADSSPKSQPTPATPTPTPAPPVTNDTLAVNPPPATNQAEVPFAPAIVTGQTNAPPRALPVTDDEAAGTNSAPAQPTPAPATPPPVAAAADTNSEPNVPVAPVAKAEDYSGTNAAPASPASTNNASTNAPPSPTPNDSPSTGTKP